MSTINASYAHVYITSHGVSREGDSGALVTDLADNAVGLVVGGSGNVMTFVQDITYQLSCLATINHQFVNISLAEGI